MARWQTGQNSWPLKVFIRQSMWGLYMLSFVPAMLTAVGVGLGFFCGLFIFAALREKIDELFVPKSFRGLPIELLAAGIISMALLAFK